MALPYDYILYYHYSINFYQLADLIHNSSGTDITQICDNQHRLHVQERSGTILVFVYVRTIKMPH